jgi:hypothetical protein
MLRGRIEELNDLIQVQQQPVLPLSQGLRTAEWQQKPTKVASDSVIYNGANSLLPEAEQQQNFVYMTPVSNNDESEDDIDEKGEIDGAAFLTDVPVVLPPPPQAWILLQEYLVDFNRAVPLFDEEKLVSLYTDVFSESPSSDCMQLKGVLSTLAIAYRLRAMSPFASESDNQNAKHFIEQTSVALPRILVGRPSLPSIQFLTAMALVMHGTHDPQGTRALVAAAIRMIEDLSPRSPAYDPAQAARVFWVAASIDTDLAIRAGRWSSVIYPGQAYSIPPTLDHVGVVPVGERTFPIFQYHTDLVQIQARFIDRVGSKPQHLTSGDLENQRYFHSLRQVVTDLQTWRSGESLFQDSPDSFRQSLDRSDFVHILVLEATYFLTMFTLRGAQTGIGPFSGSVMLHLSHYRSLDFSEHLGDATRLLSIFDLLPHGDVAVVWLSLEAIACATHVLLSAANRGTAAKASFNVPAVARPCLQLLRRLLHQRPQKRLRVALAELEALVTLCIPA